MIEGGWSFVWSAFGISWVTLLGYGLYLFFTASALNNENEEEQA